MASCGATASMPCRVIADGAKPLAPKAVFEGLGMWLLSLVEGYAAHPTLFGGSTAQFIFWCSPWFKGGFDWYSYPLKFWQKALAAKVVPRMGHEERTMGS